MLIVLILFGFVPYKEDLRIWIEQKNRMKKDKLTGEELHELGIKWVYKHIKDEFKILSVNIEFEKNPQILAKKNDELHFIVVKTSTYPDLGSLTPSAAEEIIKHADKHKAKILFANVGVANADTKDEKEMQYPLKGGQYYINFTGLSIEPNILQNPFA
ncbi:hypothetical protein L3049_20155 [Labilibaculum sp. DW002]|uniref:Uncharacterized protein n=1 Tax=Paralabilibaculum antarcticum TaxID=2912572 RepID=A0ABT5W0F2_9BACT|nr:MULTISPECIES: hypothetical protein [unclassified Labilibaculum]MDE5420313.1 hypothetical protein [Labilibaculum sp. DW002]